MSSALLSAIFINRIRRRIVFLLSESVVCICLLVLGGYFYIVENDPETAGGISWLFMTSLIIFVTAFSLGVGSLPFLITSEVLPAKFRVAGTWIALSTNWITSFIVTKSFVNMQEAMTLAGTFWFFAFVSFLAVLFAIFILPETKNRSPHEIIESAER